MLSMIFRLCFPTFPLLRRHWCGHLLTASSLLAGPSRCYPFWQELLGCYVINAGEGDAGKKKCVAPMEDYFECLHHKKEVRPDPR